MIPACDRDTVRQTESIIANTAFCVASYADTSSSSVPYSLVRTLAARQTKLLQPTRSFVDCSNSSVDKCVQTLMSSHHARRGLPLPRVPCTIPVMMHFSKLSSSFLIVCPKYPSFLDMTELHNFLPSTSSKMSSFRLLAVHGIRISRL